MKVLAFIGGDMPDAKTRVNSSRWKATVRGRKGVFYQSVAMGKGKVNLSSRFKSCPID